MGRELRVVARATATAAAVAGLCAATGVASGQTAPAPQSVRVDKLALSLGGQPGNVSVRTRPLDFGDGVVYELVGSGSGQGFDKVSGALVCYDLLYVFNCDSKRREMLHERFGLAGRSVKSFLTPGPGYAPGYAPLYRYRVDHTYRFLLQKRGQDLSLVQTCVFSPPTPCIGAARQSLPDEGSVRLAFSTRNDSTPTGAFRFAVNRIGSAAPPNRVDPTGDTGAHAASILPGMAPQTPGQALAVIRAIVTRNADACGIRRWGVSVSGFPG